VYPKSTFGYSSGGSTVVKGFSARIGGLPSDVKCLSRVQENYLQLMNRFLLDLALIIRVLIVANLSSAANKSDTEQENPEVKLKPNKTEKRSLLQLKTMVLDL
jgi:hypothetical protein